MTGGRSVACVEEDWAGVVRTFDARMILLRSSGPPLAIQLPMMICERIQRSDQD